MDAAPRFSVILPRGELNVAEGGTASVRLRLSAEQIPPARAAVDAMSRLDASAFWPCEACEVGPAGVMLRFGKQAPEMVPLRAFVGQWRENAAVFVQRTLSLAQQIVAASSALEQLKPHRFLLSP